MLASSIRISKVRFLVLSALLIFVCAAACSAQTSAAPKIYAQKLVDETLAAHPELMGLEISTTPPGKTECVTVASDEAEGIGEKCDNDEHTVMKTGKPFVDRAKENGKEFYDVNIPMRDASGKIVAIAGLDFKPGANQTEAAVAERSHQIVKELETKVTSKEKLFAPAN